MADLRRIITGVHNRNRTGSTNAATGSGSATSDFRNIVGFLESRLGGTSSEIDGKKVVHTTTRERVLVWLLLGGMMTIAVTGYMLFGGDGKAPAKAAPAVATPAATAPAEAPAATTPPTADSGETKKPAP